MGITGLLNKSRFAVKGLKNGTFLLALVILLCGYWLLFHYETLGYYWNDSDLHEIRRFSTSEIIRVFSENWDVDGIETTGFRPFSVLFNHLRITLIGESPPLQRLFLLALAASLLWMIGWICLRMGLRRGPLALALLIFVSTKAFTIYIVWIADGKHIFADWLLAMGVIAMLNYIDFSRGWQAALALLFFCAALLTLEETLISLLLIPILFALYQYRVLGKPTTIRQVFSNRFLGFFAALWGSEMIIFLYGSYVLPQRNLDLHLSGLLDDIRWSIYLVGMPVAPWRGGVGGPFYSGGGVQIFNLYGIGIGALSSAFLLIARRKAILQAAICLLILILASTPGLIASGGNRIALPTLFFSLALGITLVEVWEIRSKMPGRTMIGTTTILLMVPLVCVITIGGSMRRAIRQSQDMHPLSINQVWREYSIILSDEPWDAPIPVERRNYLINKLRDLGISSENDLEAAYAEAKSNGWTTPVGNTRIFVPPFPFINP